MSGDVEYPSILNREHLQLILDELNSSETRQEIYEAITGAGGYQLWKDAEPSAKEMVFTDAALSALRRLHRSPDDYGFESLYGHYLSGATSVSDGENGARVAILIWDQLLETGEDLHWGVRPWSEAHDDFIASHGNRRTRRLTGYASDAERTREALLRAVDTLSVLIDRIYTTDLNAGDKFEFPEMEDIQEELKADSLALGFDDIGALEGNARFELLRVRPTLEEELSVDRPALVSGAYQGLHSSRRIVNGAVSKRMYMVALEELLEKVAAIAYREEEELD